MDQGTQRRSYRRHFIIVSILVAIVAIISIVGLWAVPTFPIASTQAITVDWLFDLHLAVIGFLFALVMVFMLYILFVFRRRPGEEGDGDHFEGNTRLEIIWTVVPLIVVLSFGVIGAVTLRDVTAAQANEMTVNVTAFSFGWQFDYPEQGVEKATALKLPVGRPVHFKLKSLDQDVIHSFYVAEFRVKQDLVPGKETTLRITPTEAGEFALRCAEICGLNHTQMVATVRVLDTAGFQAWVDEKSAAPAFADMTPEERGAFWHSAEGFGCIACHSLDGAPGVGPTWQGLYGRQEALTDGSTVTVDDAYIISSILDPNSQITAGYQPNLMPQNYGDQIAARKQEIQAAEGVDIDITADLIAFIKTLE